jgi:hypothetical protein
LQPGVDLHRAAEDALELVDIAQQRRAVLLLDVEQEVLVASAAVGAAVCPEASV